MCICTACNSHVRTRIFISWLFDTQIQYTFQPEWAVVSFTTLPFFIFVYGSQWHFKPVLPQNSLLSGLELPTCFFGFFIREIRFAFHIKPWGARQRRTFWNYICLAFHNKPGVRGRENLFGIRFALLSIPNQMYEMEKNLLDGPFVLLSLSPTNHSVL